MDLTSKGPKPIFCQKTLKIAILLQRVKRIENCFFCTSNCRILYLSSLEMCGISFKKFGLSDCKIYVFKVKKTIVFPHCETRLFEFKPTRL